MSFERWLDAETERLSKKLAKPSTSVGKTFVYPRTGVEFAVGKVMYLSNMPNTNWRILQMFDDSFMYCTCDITGTPTSSNIHQLFFKGNDSTFASLRVR